MPSSRETSAQSLAASRFPAKRSATENLNSASQREFRDQNRSPFLDFPPPPVEGGDSTDDSAVELSNPDPLRGRHPKNPLPLPAQPSLKPKLPLTPTKKESNLTANQLQRQNNNNGEEVLKEFSSSSTLMGLDSSQNGSQRTKDWAKEASNLRSKQRSAASVSPVPTAPRSARDNCRSNELQSAENNVADLSIGKLEEKNVRKAIHRYGTMPKGARIGAFLQSLKEFPPTSETHTEETTPEISGMGTSSGGSNTDLSDEGLDHLGSHDEKGQSDGISGKNPYGDRNGGALMVDVSDDFLAQIKQRLRKTADPSQKPSASQDSEVNDPRASVIRSKAAQIVEIPPFMQKMKGSGDEELTCDRRDCTCELSSNSRDKEARSGDPPPLPSPHNDDSMRESLHENLVETIRSLRHVPTAIGNRSDPPMDRSNIQPTKDLKNFTIETAKVRSLAKLDALVERNADDFGSKSRDFPSRSGNSQSDTEQTGPNFISHLRHTKNLTDKLTRTESGITRDQEDAGSKLRKAGTTTENRRSERFVQPIKLSTSHSVVIPSTTASQSAALSCATLQRCPRGSVAGRSSLVSQQSRLFDRVSEKANIESLSEVASEGSGLCRTHSLQEINVELNGGAAEPQRPTVPLGTVGRAHTILFKTRPTAQKVTSDPSPTSESSPVAQVQRIKSGSDGQKTKAVGVAASNSSSSSPVVSPFRHSFVATSTRNGGQQPSEINSSPRRPISYMASGTLDSNRSTPTDATEKTSTLNKPPRAIVRPVAPPRAHLLSSGANQNANVKGAGIEDNSDREKVFADTSATLQDRVNKDSILDLYRSLDSNVTNLKQMRSHSNSSFIQLSDKLLQFKLMCSTYAENISPHSKFRFRELVAKLDTYIPRLRTCASCNADENQETLLLELENTVRDVMNLVQR